jgi:leader peptidase (prepilin peptidase)/N-methyltransferase
MSSILGAVVGIAMKLSATCAKGRFVPFGPFLAGGGLVVLLVGPADGAGAGWAGPAPGQRDSPARSG